MKTKLVRRRPRRSAMIIMEVLGALGVFGLAVTGLIRALTVAAQTVRQFPREALDDLISGQGLCFRAHLVSLFSLPRRTPAARLLSLTPDIA